MAKSFIVTLKRSLIGCTETQRATMAALGLKKRHQSVKMADNAANRGQIFKVQHLVNVQVEK
jgi:large subunit ribosomal protein L30